MRWGEEIVAKNGGGKKEEGKKCQKGRKYKKIKERNETELKGKSKRPGVKRGEESGREGAQEKKREGWETEGLKGAKE